jgi:hypothetical protein
MLPLNFPLNTYEYIRDDIKNKSVTVSKLSSYCIIFMRLSYFFIFVILSLVAGQSTATSHAISPILSYNLSQTDTPAYGLFYQYHFYDAIELELGLLQKSNVELNEDNLISSSQYDSIFIGTNFIRQYTKNIQLKIGGGVSYISSSTNDQLVERQSYSPYVKFAANMSLSNNVSLEFGQMTQFIIGNLELSHSVFLGLTWKFGKKKIKKPPQVKTSNVVLKPALKSNLSSTATPVLQNSVLSPGKYNDIQDAMLIHPNIQQQVTTEPLPRWSIQLGAFQENNSAEKQRAIMATQQVETDEIFLRIINHKGLYKIFSPTFTSRQHAVDWLQQANSTYQWRGFPVLFTH